MFLRVKQYLTKPLFVNKPGWLWRFECWLFLLDCCLSFQQKIEKGANALRARWSHWKEGWQGLQKILVLLKSEVERVESVDPAHTDDIDYAVSASRAVLYQDPKGARQILILTTCFIAVCCVWATFAEVNEYARGTGKVIPSGRLQVVQNLEGGIVAELYVHEGERVERGQPLLRIDDTQFASNYREQEQQRQYLRVKTARLQAELDDKPFLPRPDLADVDAVVLQQENSLYTSRQQDVQGQLRILDEQVTQKKHEVSEAHTKADQLKISYDLSAQELNMTEPLVAKGAISKVDVLRLRRQTNDTKGQLDVTRQDIARAEASLQEVQNKKDSLRLQFVSKTQEELNVATTDLAKLDELRGALADKVKRTTVRSPVAGKINRLLINTVGGVIQPGKDLVEVVPSEDSLQMEARISPVDIAYLHPGQKVIIKITAYDFTVYGGLDGKLMQISPDSLVDQNGSSYFMVYVETDQHFLGKMGNRLEIIPGMTVDVEILTGEKTILSYIMKPVLRAKSRAFSER
jgi:adhesin transport system membrane fusion protein